MGEWTRGFAEHVAEPTFNMDGYLGAAAFAAASEMVADFKAENPAGEAISPLIRMWE